MPPDVYSANIQGQLKVKGVLRFGLYLPPGFWEFPIPTSSVTLSNFNINTNPSGSIEINWGDNTSDTIASGSNITHTYS